MNWTIAIAALMAAMAVVSLVRLVRRRRADDLFSLVFWLVLLLFHLSRYGLLLGLCAFALLGRVLFRGRLLVRGTGGSDVSRPTAGREPSEPPLDER